MDEDKLPVARLRNLGPKSARLLAEAGIRTIAELRLLGAAIRLQNSRPKRIQVWIVGGTLVLGGPLRHRLEQSIDLCPVTTLHRVKELLDLERDVFLVVR